MILSTRPVAKTIVAYPVVASFSPPHAVLEIDWPDVLWMPILVVVFVHAAVALVAVFVPLISFVVAPSSLSHRREVHLPEEWRLVWLPFSSPRGDVYDLPEPFLVPNDLLVPVHVVLFLRGVVLFLPAVDFL
jgi:hypothetical protein